MTPPETVKRRGFLGKTTHIRCRLDLLKHLERSEGVGVNLLAVYMLKPKF